MEIIQIPNNEASITATLAEGEEIVCRNATVIAKGDVVTGWFDNEKPLLFIGGEE